VGRASRQGSADLSAARTSAGGSGARADPRAAGQERADPAPDFRALFESLPGSYLVLDPDLVIVAASDAYLRDTLTTRAEIVGKGVFEVFPDNPADSETTAVSNSRVSFNRVRQNLVADTMAVQRHDIRTPGTGGKFEIRHWSPVNSPVLGPDNRLAYIIHHVEDVTAYVELAEDHSERQQLTDGMRLRTRQMEADILARSRELQQANKLLEAFTYSVAHDLRAPLRAMHGFTEALLEEYGDHLGGTGRGYAARIQAASERMAALIDQLLLMSRVSRADMHLGPVNLSAEVASIISELQLQAREPDRRVRFSIQDDVWVTADRALIRSAVQNLIENAWKFTARRSDAVIEFGATTAEDARICCYVRDNGAGFEPECADKLFEPFQRLHAASEFPGTGIGLASVHRIIERHGGRIWAQGAVDNGATFCFTLAAAGRASQNDLNGCSILTDTALATP
jgi:signal transduction histidine kinase